MVEAADASRSPMSGRLRLGVIPTVSPFLLPRLMPALRTAFPALRLFLREDTTRNLVEDLGNGRLDLALLALPCACAGTDTMKVARDIFFAALPAGHPLAEQEMVTASALAAETLLLLEDGHCLRDQALSACGVEHDDGPGGEYAATSLHTLAQMVAGGLGVTVLPELAIRAGITDGTGIVLRRIAGDGAYRTLGFAWRPGAPRAAEFRALAPVLAATVGA